jgi:hypothetical protein
MRESNEQSMYVTAILPRDLLGDPALTVSATVATTIDAPVEDVFDWFVDLDIARVLNGYGPLPAVLETREQTGPWKVVGQTRTLSMSGNIRATQQVLVCDRPRFFAYRVTGFTHVLDSLSHGAEARWWFDPISDRSTSLRWTYTFWPRSIVGKLGIYPVIRSIWHWYMQSTIQQMKRIAEIEIAGRPQR